MPKLVFGNHKPGLPKKLDGATVEIVKKGEEFYLVKTEEGLVYAARPEWLAGKGGSAPMEEAKEEIEKDEVVISEDVSREDALKLLTSINGIGKKTAEKLIEDGILTLEELGQAISEDKVSDGRVVAAYEEHTTE